MSRLIDADECRKYFYEHLDDNAIEGAMNAIDEMPTVEQWIPVSERLPDKSDKYLVWMTLYDESHTFSITNYDADCEAFGEWHYYFDQHTLGFLDSDFEEIKDVIAWMPLPEPYTPLEK